MRIETDDYFIHARLPHDKHWLGAIGEGDDVLVVAWHDDDGIRPGVLDLIQGVHEDGARVFLDVRAIDDIRFADVVRLVAPGRREGEYDPGVAGVVLPAECRRQLAAMCAMLRRLAPDLELVWGTNDQDD